MSYLKLMKLLYFADRIALQRHGRPLSFDQYASLPRGPVLSRTLDLIKSEPDPSTPSYWSRFICDAPDFSVKLRPGVAVPVGALSPVEEGILDEVFAEHGHRTRWELVELSHQLPEWEDPHGSSIPIELEEILKAGGLSEADAQAIRSELEAESAMDELAE